MKTQMSSDIDIREVSQILVDAGVDLRAEEAFLKSADFSIKTKAVDGIEYNIDISLSASDNASFNKLFNNLIQQ